MDIPESKQLKKDNRIIVASYNISSFENKIYNYILREIQIKINITKNELSSIGLEDLAIERKISNTILVCEISKSELANLTNSNQQKNIVFIKNTLLNLKGKSIDIKDLNCEGNLDWISANFFSSVQYESKNNMFYIRIDPLIYISIIKNFEKNGNFTPIDLNNLFKLRSFYSQRLYELLRKWSLKNHTISYKLEDLKDYLLGHNYKVAYNKVSEFKRIVLEPAIKELISKELFKDTLTYSQKKNGRTITHIIFENVYDLKNRITLGNRDIKKILIRNSKIDFELKKELVESNDITIDIMQALIDIDYKTLIKSFTIKIFKYENEIFIAPLDVMGRNFYMRYKSNILKTINLIYKDIKIFEYSENIISEKFTTKYEDYKMILQ